MLCVIGAPYRKMGGDSWMMQYLQNVTYVAKMGYFEKKTWHRNLVGWVVRCFLWRVMVYL